MSSQAARRHGATASGELSVSPRAADTTRREESGSIPASDAAPAYSLREALEFVADWAHDCADGDRLYGFADIERLARRALERPA